MQVGYEERRRLERDLHDGAQQRLVSLGMALRLAQRHLDDADVDGLLDQTVAELGTAVAELRQIAQRPAPEQPRRRPARRARGADRSTCRSRSCSRSQGEPLPDDVATTVYYVTSEAIANAVKHAGATRIDVRIARDDGRLAVRVSDDGRGGALLAAGSGLAGLSDRVSAIGGELALESRDGRGTTVEALVPCGS